MGTIAGLAAMVFWLAVILLPWQPWRTRERLEAEGNAGDTDLSDITVIIPARDEAAVIGETLTSLRSQGRGLRVIVVDDQSTDGTAAVAARIGGRNFDILHGEPLPVGWTGKLWALEQGRRIARTPLLLLLDADITLTPGTITALRAQLKRGPYQLVSLMATLSMRRSWEKWLLPAFIYFFKLLYPFRLSNSRSPWVAAAAGGCILLEAQALETIGGFMALRRALIDDCTLARRFKENGFRTWIGLSRSARSLRPYPNLAAVSDMVTRTAYTQLRHSIVLLVLCTALMMIGFWLAPLTIVLGTGIARVLATVALTLMFLSYLPIVRFYRMSPALVMTLPVAATLYLGMTWLSAFYHWRGAGVVWKARNYP